MPAAAVSASNCRTGSRGAGITGGFFVRSFGVMEVCFSLRYSHHSCTKRRSEGPAGEKREKGGIRRGKREEDTEGEERRRERG